MHGKLPVVCRLSRLDPPPLDDNRALLIRVTAWRYKRAETRGYVRCDVADRTDAFSLVVHAESRRASSPPPHFSLAATLRRTGERRPVGRSVRRAGGRTSEASCWLARRLAGHSLVYRAGTHASQVHSRSCLLFSLYPRPSAPSYVTKHACDQSHDPPLPFPIHPRKRQWNLCFTSYV